VHDHHQALFVYPQLKPCSTPAGDRYLTPWLKVLGPGAPPVPVVHVTVRRAGEDILGVKAMVHTAPVEYEHQHKALVDEWLNASAWPKHLLIRYHFVSEREVDLDQGLYVLMAIGGCPQTYPPTHALTHSRNNSTTQPLKRHMASG
jgi:hypothetical protein